MAKYEFKKDPKRKTKKIEETKISEPENTFSLKDFSREKKREDNKNSDSPKKGKGRPRKNKIYSTIRIQKNNVNRINALQNTLEFDTQDDLINSLLEKAETNLNAERRMMFEMYMKTYIARENRNHSISHD